MKPKTRVKIVVDILMTIALLLLMAFHITGEQPHEWIGAGAFVLFITHHILNWSWVKNLNRGKYSAYRIVQLVMNLLLFFCMLGIMLSGIILSRHVFAFLPISGGTAFARTLHHVCAYCGYTLMSVHIGQHWGMMLGMMRRAAGTTMASKKRRILLRVLALLLAVYGAYTFIARQFPKYMFNRIEYTFFDYTQPAVIFFFDYIAIMALFVCLGHYAMRWIQRKQSWK